MEVASDDLCVFPRSAQQWTTGQNPKESSMTKIRARCPSCGDVEFGIERIVVIGSTDANSYRFACPSCEEQVSRSAVPDVIELLVSAGVRREALQSPPSRTKSSETKPLTENDVSSFRDLLSSPDWFESLQSSIDRRD
jgi:predicted RNA-binding Zn-ribbon protein involved in translation (DUF1610 family)